MKIGEMPELDGNRAFAYMIELGPVAVARD